MKPDTVRGLALILGSLGLLVTMAFHPTAGGLEGLVREAAIRVRTHSLGLVCIPVTFFGFLGLHERIKADGTWAPAALIVYGFGCVAAMCAAVLNGLAAPAFAAHVAAHPTLRDTAPAVLAYSFLLNAAFARVFMVGAAAALVLWSIAIRRTGAFRSWTAWFGGLLGGAGLVGVLGGFLGTSVHEFGLFVLGLAAWTVVIGVLLCGPPALGRVA